MATIVVSDLRPAGSSLFTDSESYMNELVDSELGHINGGATPATLIAAGKFAVGAAKASSGYCVRGVSMAGGIGAYFTTR